MASPSGPIAPTNQYAAVRLWLAHHPIVSGVVAIAALLVGVASLITSTLNSKLTTRPYVGPVGTVVELMRCDRSGCVDSPPETANILRYNQYLKNTGTLPADNTFAKQHVYLDGAELPSVDGDDHPRRILPGTTFHYPGEIGLADYPAIASGKKKYYIEMTVVYEWPGGSEKRCYESRYAPQIHSMMEFGDCSPFTHTPGDLHTK